MKDRELNLELASDQKDEPILSGIVACLVRIDFYYSRDAVAVF